MLFVSIAEIFSIGAVLPFLAIIINPEKAFSFLGNIAFLDIQNNNWDQNELVIALAIIFGIAALLAGLMRLLLLWYSTRLSYAVGADLSIEIYRRTLYQPFSVHVSRNSSEVIDGISTKTNSAIHVINSVLNYISSIVILLAILFALSSINIWMTLIVFGCFSAIYIAIYLFTRARLSECGKIIANESVNVIKSLQEGLGGIRDVLIDGSQPIYCEIYRNADQPIRKAQASIIFISSAPRYGIEALGMIMIASIVITLSINSYEIINITPVLGTLALGAQRLMPLLQQIYSASAVLRGGAESLMNTLELLDQPMPIYLTNKNTNIINFNNNVTLEKISFIYESCSLKVLDNVNIVIKKGSRVGFMGPTGSGKSTLLDIVMGLLVSTDGSISVDGQRINLSNYHEWQKKIAHVPQNIYLSDGSVSENIAFGIPHDQIDIDRIKRVAKLAQISKIVDSLPDKYNTKIGERGVRLSGGQRQRIGIARALYKKADLIIFDEATSALDNETEENVMKAIESIGEEITVLVIAHRLTTLKACTKIYELMNGKITRSGTYEEIVLKIKKENK